MGEWVDWNVRCYESVCQAMVCMVVSYEDMLV